MSDGSNIGNSAASTSESSDNDSPLLNRKRRRKQLETSSDNEDSDIESQILNRQHRKKRVAQIVSSEDSSSSSENEEIVTFHEQRLPRNLSGTHSASRHNEASGSESNGLHITGDSDFEQLTKLYKLQDEDSSESSSDNDEQAERCPICLTKFKGQNVASLECCDHSFCVECIHKWSKNAQTCPVDRQQFALIIIRKHFGGEVIKDILLPPPSDHPPVVVEDTTECVICRQNNNEDRMLLCDFCDLGYHMECLEPPLHAVPLDDWYCPTCLPFVRVIPRQLEGQDISEVPHRLESMRRPLRVSRSERLTRRQQQASQLSTSSGVESMEGSSPVMARQRKTRRRTKTRPRFRIKKIVTDDGVIEVLLKRKSKRKNRRKKRRVRAQTYTVKARLANRLGMCALHMLEQMIPETTNNRPHAASASINHQRRQAGIPTLDLFGRREQFEYPFSGLESEDEVGDIQGGGGVGLLSRPRIRRPHDRLFSLKKAATIFNSTRIKNPAKIEPVSAPASRSLLDSILDSQTLWHSKEAEIRSKSDGSIQVILPKSSKNIVGSEENKTDKRQSSTSIIEAPMFPSGKSGTGAYNFGNQGSQSNGGGKSGVSQSYDGRSSSSTSNTSSGPSPLRGTAPIRFRMTVPPRRPNIHSYPSDNIPPPPPLRLRSPLVDSQLVTPNSPDAASPTRDDEDIDIYSDIVQGNSTNNENEEKSFGALLPPPEPPFPMTMEPPPAFPALLSMTLNDVPGDDEATGLVIADEPTAVEEYDPCAINSDDSSVDGSHPAKTLEISVGLCNPELVANYSSDSATDVPYNPEMPTYSGTPIIGPLPRPASHNSSDGEDNTEDCPNFSMYSAESVNLARRGMTVPDGDLNIAIPPAMPTNFDIPLPDPPKDNRDEESLNIPIPPEDNKSLKQTDETSEKQVEDNIIINKFGESMNKTDDDSDSSNNNNECGEDDSNSEVSNSDKSRDNIDGTEKNKDQDKENGCCASVECEPHESKKSNVTEYKLEKSVSKLGPLEDESSTQGDVLDLAVEPEANIENNMQNEETEEKKTKCGMFGHLNDLDGEKNLDSGEKSDGLVDITDEEMSDYDCPENDDTLFGQSTNNKDSSKLSLYSDDESSLIGGATSAVSAGTLNTSDNLLPPTLPGLEGLETETISESEDVNFDEIPMEGNKLPEINIDQEDNTETRKKKKKKYRKTNHDNEGCVKVSIEPLDFEEGEIVEDKPKQLPKKDKKLKAKSDNSVKADVKKESNKIITSIPEEILVKRTKKKKEKVIVKDKNEKTKDIKEKTLKPGKADENVAWKKLSKSTKERNYRDGKEKEKDVENKSEEFSKKDKRNKEKRKELERYNVRRLISEKPKRPKKDEFGRDISPSKSGSSLSPYRPPRYRSPLRTRNRSRSRSRSYKSRSRSRGRKARRRSRSRDRIRSMDRSRRSRSIDRCARRSRSRNKILNRYHEQRRTKTPDRHVRDRNNRSLSKSRRRSKTPSIPSRRHRSYSRSWSLSWSRSSISRSRSPSNRRRSRSFSRSKSWTREQNMQLLHKAKSKGRPKNLTVIVTNKDALKKKEKKRTLKKKYDQKKKKHNQSPAPSKEVFTSGDNILVSVNFKNANKTQELIPATTSLITTKRKREEETTASKKKKSTNIIKKTSVPKKSSKSKVNEAARNAKPVAIIDLDLSPFREVDLSPKEVIVLSDSGDEDDKQHSVRQDEINQSGNSGMNLNISVSSIDHKQKNTISQPESSNFILLNSSGPKTPPEPHIKFSISTKPSQVRVLSNPLMEVDEEMHDENNEDVNEILHKGPNTPPEPPPDLNTPASPPTTPYDPFDPTKSRSPSPQPQHNNIREDKLDNLPDENEEQPITAEPRSSPSSKDPEDLRRTPELAKAHSTPKSDPLFGDLSPPKASPCAGPLETNKLPEDSLLKCNQKSLTSSNKLDLMVHKSPEKLIVAGSQQQVKSLNLTPKQLVFPLKPLTPNKHPTPKGNPKQLFSSTIVKQVPILGALSLLSNAPPYNPALNLNNKAGTGRSQQNGDSFDDMDIDPSSPYSPGSSEGDDLFEPPIATPPRTSSKLIAKAKPAPTNKFDALFGSPPPKARHSKHTLSKANKKSSKTKFKGMKKEEVKVKLDEDQLKILDELPSSAVEMQVKDKFLKKLNRQERVVEEVKLVLKPHYAKKHVTKEEYKDILRRAVPKICHNKSGEINPMKIQFLIEAYVKKFRYAKKKA